MARRRMFNLDIIDTDLFLDMPQTSRLLYYELCMRADDDGFVGSPKKIQKMVGCSEDDFKVLISKQFIIPFDTGVVVIRHWKIHNYIQKDRYKETIYINEKKQLKQEENGMYTECIQDGNTGKSSIGKDSIGKISSSSVETLYDPRVEKIQDIMLETLGTTNTNNTKECCDYLDKIPLELIEYALRKTARVSNPSWQYAIPILESYIAKGFKTVKEVEADDLKFKSRNNPTSKEETEEEKNARKLRELEEAIRNGT